MLKRLVMVLLVLSLVLASASQAADIVLVNETYDTDGDGVQDDQALIDWLVAEGHNVDVQPDIWVDLDPNEIALLDAADLVIMSRASNSGNYDDGDEPTQWNSVTTPLIQMSAYLVRSSRWRWIDSTSVTNVEGAVMEAVDASHPVFTYLDLASSNPDDPNAPAVLLEASDPTIGTGQTSLIGTLDMGNGTLIAKGAGADAAWIAEWEAGVEFYAGSGQMPAAQRMMFCGGTQEVDATPQGAWNFTEAGADAFRNAINYMLGGASIVLVTEEADADADAEWDDQNLVNWLVDQGHFVDVQRGTMMELDDGEIDLLNAADLVIFSRSTNSGNYDDGDEPTQWNAITTPLIQMSAYLVRNSRWHWLDTGTATNNSGAPAMQVLDPNHPIFAGVTLDPNNVVVALDPNVGAGETSFAGSLDAGNGMLLAQAVGADLAWIAEWPTGVEFYEGAGQSAGGKRLFFAAGTQEVGTTPQGALNLSAEGELMFANAIAYMLVDEGDPLARGLLANYSFDDGAADASGNGYDATLLGDAVILDGTLVLDGEDDAVDVPRLGGADATFGQCTIAMWVLPTADLVPLQFAGGMNTNGWVAGAVHLKLSYGQLNAGINGLDGGDLQGTTAVMPGVWVHLAMTISPDEVVLYMDGQVEDSRVLEAPLEGLILGEAALGAWNNDGELQREMAGLMDDIYVYERALSQEELIALAGL